MADKSKGRQERRQSKNNASGRPRRENQRAPLVSRPLARTFCTRLHHHRALAGTERREYLRHTYPKNRQPPLQKTAHSLFPVLSPTWYCPERGTNRADGVEMRVRFFQIMLGLCLVSGVASTSCYTGQASQRTRTSKAYLRLKISPADAQIYIDEKYQGVVERWRDGVVPVEPGPRRLELRAEDHYTERFDLDVGANEELEITLEMEPLLETVAPAED